MSYIAAVLLLSGAVITFLATVGVLKFRDVFLRMHASSKSASLGVIIMFVGTAFHFAELDVAFKMAVAVFLVFLKTPVASQCIARAAYFLHDQSFWHTLERNEWHGTAPNGKAEETPTRN
ncbi:monovalent cation/H(+) antiporter subunit G [Sulfidibacter corallicola]|uniref:Monovalent cation/H(+) antiporter subunit G n=1 Tax=Sulfidibacter corallicola TaxID=2818388 RepID=A0A8A4TTU1_SULCO|nr:monovalent cation/H(+) antiporter subunit G [Sulfidibacter corallicola]QTD49945.1 monovalent cation/H(+) antiporter subunit G [Sulfidibacter corallicola]